LVVASVPADRVGPPLRSGTVPARNESPALIRIPSAGSCARLQQDCLASEIDRRARRTWLHRLERSPSPQRSQRTRRSGHRAMRGKLCGLGDGCGGFRPIRPMSPGADCNFVSAEGHWYGGCLSCLCSSEQLCNFARALDSLKLLTLRKSCSAGSGEFQTVSHKGTKTPRISLQEVDIRQFNQPEAPAREFAASIHHRAHGERRFRTGFTQND